MLENGRRFLKRSYMIEKWQKIFLTRGWYMESTDYETEWYLYYESSELYFTNIYIYIYIYRERERDRQTDRQAERYKNNIYM